MTMPKINALVIFVSGYSTIVPKLMKLVTCFVFFLFCFVFLTVEEEPDVAPW